MKMKLFLLVSFFFILHSKAQQEPFFKTYDWEENPTYKLNENNNESIVSLKEKLVTEFYFEGENFVEYFLEHKIIWLNSDDAIEDFNKVYLPFSSQSSLELNKARVITPQGKVIILDESKILTASDEETGKKYKYFAFEGITKGSFIEYYYVVKKDPIYRGKKIMIQASFPKKRIEFDLFAPTNLFFKTKSFNGIPEIQQDTTTTNKFHLQLKINDLEKMDIEDKSSYNASVGYIVYKLDKNLANNISDISGYSKVSQNLYEFYYADYSKKENELINAFIKEYNFNNSSDEETIARKIDYTIKTNFFTSDVSSNEMQNLEDILSKKVMNETGTIKLYIALFRALNINHELVLTSDRKEAKFDKEFESDNFLTDFMFYFPKSKKYLSPNDFNTRFGFPDAYKTDNYGLFIKEVTIGDFKSGLGKIKYINPVKADKTVDIMKVNIEFSKDDITKTIINFDRSFSGYYAMSIQPYLNLILGEKKEELIEQMAKSISEDIEITQKKLISDDPELFGVKPLQFVVDFTSEAFVEKAGKKYLFKLGDLIGAQMEMYQEKKRVLAFEEEHQRSYYRTLTVNIPEGYKIANLNDINIDNSYSEKGNELFSFKSFYKLENNKLTITADEHYRENLIDVGIYEQYRKVINSAADFNKIVLLLEAE